MGKQLAAQHSTIDKHVCSMGHTMRKYMWKIREDQEDYSVSRDTEQLL